MYDTLMRTVMWTLMRDVVGDREWTLAQQMHPNRQPSTWKGGV